MSSSRPASAPHRGWTLDVGDPETVLANARKAFFVMVGVLALLWIIQIANWADGYQLTASYGIKPRDISSLPYILTAPFLHFSWTHIEGNSGPLFIFGFLAAYRGIGKFVGVTAIAVLTSGLAAWFFEPSGVGAGASGVVFGYFGYIMVRGLFDRHLIDVIIGAVMALCFAYQFTVLVPQHGIGWQAHIGGLVGGILAGWLLRDRRAARRVAAGAASATVTAGTSVQPTSRGIASPAQTTQSQTAKTGKTGKKDKPGGKGLDIDPTNPRADLYKQLDDLGL